MSARYAAIGLLFLAACSTGDSSVDGSGAQSVTRCGASTDCGDDESCSSTLGFCVRRLPAGTTLTMAIVPGADSDAILDQFNEATNPDHGRLDVTMTPPAVISGRIVEPEGAGTFVQTGKLIAEADGRIPGMRFRHEVRATADDSGTSWTIKVASDMDYALTFVPDDTTIPPLTKELRAGVSGTSNIEIASGTLELSGIVRRLSGDSRIPVPGAVVQAVVGGLPVTSDVTDIDGVFELLVPDTPGEIRLDTASGDSGLQFPTRTRTWTDMADLKSDMPATDFLVVDVDPVPDAASVSFQVLGRSATGSIMPMGGCSLFLEGAAGDGTWRARTVVDGNGFSTLKLPVGRYDVTVLPPGGSPGLSLKSTQFAWDHVITTVNANQENTVRVDLDLRPTISGRVVYSADAIPVAGARVVLATDTAMLTGWPSGFAFDVIFAAVTDENGEFQLSVEPGTYSMQVVPPAGSAMATASWSLVTLAGTENIRVGLGSGCLLGGKVVTADGTPGKDATVSFFQPTSRNFWQNWPMAFDSFANSIRQLGEVRTDSDGRYEVVLPCPDDESTAAGSTFEAW